jgi:hypothetical protein
MTRPIESYQPNAEIPAEEPFQSLAFSTTTEAASDFEKPDSSVSGPSTTQCLLARQEELWSLHPVVLWDESFALPTPSLEAVAEIVSQSIYARRSGRGFFAAPRYGKSTAIHYLTKCIHDTYPNVPVLVLEAIPSLRPSESDFYGDWLDAAGYKLRPARIPRERRKQLVNLLWTLPKSRAERRVVAFVDEAQEYGEHHWGWLKSIQNQLVRSGVSLIVFPFGQLELDHERSALKSSGRDDLVTRFMRRLYEFQGVNSQEELRQVMAVFDELGRYPRPDGWTFTQFFFPRAFGAGWRLVKEAPRAWQAICEAQLHHARGGVGMEWVGIMLRHFLTEFSDQDSAGWSGEPKHWRESIAASDAADIDDSDS